jgi:AcrR family transcriptional regulator
MRSKPAIARDPGDERTRERLLAAAGELFAERGFRGATVRTIAAHAGANLAAVNYHFGSKPKLYAEVLRTSFAAALVRHPPDGGLPANAPAGDRLRAFIRSLVMRARGDGRPAWQGRLMMRELADPTEAIDLVVREAIAPQFERLAAIVRDLLGPRASADEVALTVTSIVGQCLYWFTADAVIARLPALRGFRSADALDVIARHVHAFTRAALARAPERRR